MELKNYFAQDAEGNAQPNATCYLYNADTTNLANGLVDANNQPLTNPFVSNDYGLIQFKAPNGLYDLRVISGVRDYKIRVQAADASELIGGIADAVAAAAVATAAADNATSKSQIATDSAANAVDARDAAESYAINALSSVGQTQTFAIQAQQAVVDAEAVLVSKVDKSYMPIDPRNLGLDVTGVVDVAVGLNTMFNGGNKHIHITGPATYLIGAPVYLESGSKGLFVTVDPDVTFKLKDNAKCIMFQTKLGTHTTIKWKGGVLDGNSSGQGVEVLGVDGGADDFSKGFKMCKVNDLEIEQVTVKNVRGHSINHWNCTNVHIHHIQIDSYASTLFPNGGGRGDGVTGSSTYINIHDISGYSNDDMVAIAAGVDWAGSGTYQQDVEVAVVKNIRCGSKTKADASGLAYSWRGVVGYTLAGYTIGKLIVDGLFGDVAYAAYQIGSYGTYARGVCDSATFTNVKTRTRLTTGSLAGSFTLVDIGTLTLSNLDQTLADGAGYNEQFITFDNATCKELAMQSALFKNESTLSTRQERMVHMRASASISRISMTDCGFQPPTNVAASREYLVAGTPVVGTLELHCRGFRSNLKDRTNYNVSITTGALIPYSYEIVSELTQLATDKTGMFLTDVRAGQLFKESDYWKTVVPMRYPYASGAPTAGRWDLGMTTSVTDAPAAGMSGWRCMQAGTFGGTAPTFDRMYVDRRITAGANFNTYTILDMTPGSTRFIEVGATFAASAPGAGAGVCEMHRGSTDAFSYYKYSSRDTNNVYYARWDATNNVFFTPVLLN